MPIAVSKPRALASLTWRVLAVRALLLAASGALALAGFALTRLDHPAAAARAQARARYACPMHPEVASASPGQCPICKMALEPAAAPAPPPAPVAAHNEAAAARRAAIPAGVGQAL